MGKPGSTGTRIGVVRRGFTLVELLVVITIIAVLAGILFPVFQRAKAAAGDTVTLSNLKQLGTASTLYLADWDDVFPLTTDGAPGLGVQGGWAYYTLFGNTEPGVFDVSKSSLYSYVKSPDVFISKADNDAKSSHLSFAMSGALSPVSGTGLNQSVSATSLKNPAGMMLLGEEGSGEAAPLVWGYNRGTNDGYFNPSVDHFSRWHMGGTAVLFTDSHAKVLHAQDKFTETICGDSVVCW